MVKLAEAFSFELKRSYKCVIKNCKNRRSASLHLGWGGLAPCYSVSDLKGKMLSSMITAFGGKVR